ncbi:MAG TPA: YbaK/EbsC family protein [Acidimicrobiia bacterium]
MTEMPRTAAIEALDASGVRYRTVGYGRVRSAEEAAEARGIALEALAKTLVIRRDEDDYVLVLVPGDSGLDYKKLRAHLDVRRLTMPDPEEAKQATGYERGTITPLGAGGLPTIVDTRLAQLPEISLGSGAHGWAIHLDPRDLLAAFDFVEVADIAG